MHESNAMNSRRLSGGERAEQNKVRDDNVGRSPSQFRSDVICPSGSPQLRLCFVGNAPELCWYPAAKQTSYWRCIIERMRIGLAEWDKCRANPEEPLHQAVTDRHARTADARADNDPEVMAAFDQPRQHRHDEWNIAAALEYCGENAGGPLYVIA
jgi:hypothetical protein